MSGVDALCVVMGLELFWAKLRKMEAFEMLRQTCKTIHSECNVVFAVKSMGMDRKVSKIWAQRWLGLKMCWWSTGPVCLLTALCMAEGRGGLRKLSKLALEYRTKDVKYMKKLEEFRKKRERTRMLNSIFQYRMDRSDRLRKMVAEAGLPTGGKYYDHVLFGGADIDASVVERIAKYHARKAEIDAMLLSEGLPRMGDYYDSFTMSIDKELSAGALATLRFRQHLWMNDDFERIVIRLRDSRGGHYEGIFRDARAKYRQYFIVGANGRVLGKRPAGSPLYPKK
jgi:hypothetical protein